MPHNQFKKFSKTSQPFSVPYSDEEGYITNWLKNDPIIKQLQTQNEFIGTVTTCPEGSEQEVLTQFVYDQKGVAPEQGNLVNIEDRGEQWIYTGTRWLFYSDYLLMDATKTRKGIVVIGDGINVQEGKISVDSTIYTPSKNIITDNTNTQVTISNVAANTDYIYTQPLSSLTLSAITNSQYPADIYFTTGNTFNFSAPTLTEWYFNDNPPTFRSNTQYKISISEGKASVSYIGARKYPINKFTATNPQLSPNDGIATWTFSNTLSTPEVLIRVIEVSSGDTVAVDSNTTISSITISFNADNIVTAGTYKAIIIG